MVDDRTYLLGLAAPIWISIWIETAAVWIETAKTITKTATDNPIFVTMSLVTVALLWEYSPIFVTVSWVVLLWNWKEARRRNALKNALKNCFSTAACSIIVASISRFFVKDVKATKQHHKEFCGEEICAKIRASKNCGTLGGKERGIEHMITEEFPYLRCEPVLLKEAEKIVLEGRPVLMSIGQGERLWKWLLHSGTSIVSEEVAGELSKENGPSQDQSSVYVVVRFVLRTKNGNSKDRKTTLAFQSPCAPTRWVFMEKDAAAVFNAQFYQVHWTTTSVRLHPLYDELLEQFKTATPQELQRFAEHRFATYWSLKRDCEKDLVSAGLSSLLLMPTWTKKDLKKDFVSDLLATVDLGPHDELPARATPITAVGDSEQDHTPPNARSHTAISESQISVAAYSPMINQKIMAKVLQVPKSRGGICYAAAAATLVSAANSRVFMLDYRGSRKQYPDEFDQDSIAKNIVDMNHSIRPDPTKRGGDPQALIPMVYPHLQCRKIEIGEALEVLLNTPRPVLMTFSMAGFAWDRFSEFDKKDLQNGRILTEADAVAMVKEPEQANSEAFNMAGHAVVVTFLGINEGKRILVIKNSWDTATHGAKGWLLMESDAAKHFKARYYSVYWTERSLQHHPRAKDLFQQWNVATDAEKAAFNEYRKVQNQKQWQACNVALLETMGGGRGFYLQRSTQIADRFIVV